MFVIIVCQVEDSQALERLQELHDAVYERACAWFENLKNRFRNQILQHFGAMPEQEANIQVHVKTKYSQFSQESGVQWQSCLSELTCILIMLSCWYS